MSRLVCPRISPEWELAAQLALVKPKPYTRDKIAHRDPQQPWSRNAPKVIAQWLEGLGLTAEFPKAGDHRMIVAFRKIEPARVKRIARKLSRCLPELWFML